MQSESLAHVSMALTDVDPPEVDPEPPVVADDPPTVDVEPPAAWTEPSMVVSTLPLQLVTRAIPISTLNTETADELALFIVPRSIAPEPATITGISPPVFVDQPEQTVKAVLGVPCHRIPMFGLALVRCSRGGAAGVNTGDE